MPEFIWKLVFIRLFVKLRLFISKLPLLLSPTVFGLFFLFAYWYFLHFSSSVKVLMWGWGNCFMICILPAQAKTHIINWSAISWIFGFFAPTLFILSSDPQGCSSSLIYFSSNCWIILDVTSVSWHLRWDLVLCWFQSSLHSHLANFWNRYQPTTKMPGSLLLCPFSTPLHPPL